MKFHGQPCGYKVVVSHPARGAWIEMAMSHLWGWILVKSHPARGAWIEILAISPSSYWRRPSHPARGAWIEIISASRSPGRVSSRTPHGVRGLK